jgi:hypothetical protein
MVCKNIFPKGYRNFWAAVPLVDRVIPVLVFIEMTPPQRKIKPKDHGADALRELPD